MTRQPSPLLTTNLDSGSPPDLPSGQQPAGVLLRPPNLSDQRPGRRAGPPPRQLNSGLRLPGRLAGGRPETARQQTDGPGHRGRGGGVFLTSNFPPLLSVTDK